MTPKQRKTIYGTLTALLGMGVIYGFLTVEEANGWGLVIANALGMVGTGLATAKTDTTTASGMPAGETGYIGEHRQDSPDEMGG